MSECSVCHGNNHVTYEDGSYMTCTACTGGEDLMEREEILIEARALITGDRAAQYGNAADNFNRISQGWSALLGVEISAHQVALCMMWLKMSRIAHKPGRDSFVDIAGYAALGWECADA